MKTIATIPLHNCPPRLVIASVLAGLCGFGFVACGGHSSSSGAPPPPPPPPPANYRVLDLTLGTLAAATVAAPDLANAQFKTTSIVFHRVPAGTMQRGAAAASLGAQADETQTIVPVAEYWLAVFELTQAQWQALAGANDAPWTRLAPAGVVGGGAIAADRPAYGLSATAVIGALSAYSANRPFQLVLPSDDQWEYACRAGTVTLFSWGDSLDPAVAGLYAVARETASGPAGPKAVGGRQPNAFGFYDMLGNVREWTIGAAPILRGGAWSDNLVLCRSANLFRSVDQDSRYALAGARLVLVAP
jgi:formylglycine-generating enzyme required for sulfatase activity